MTTEPASNEGKTNEALQRELQALEVARKALEAANEQLQHQLQSQNAGTQVNTGFTRLANSMDGRSDIDAVPYLSNGANTLSRSGFIRKCEQIAQDDNYHNCYRAMKVRSEDSEHVSFKPTSTMMTEAEWKLCANEFVHHNRASDVGRVSRMARTTFDHLWADTKNLETYYTDAAKLLKDVRYAYELAEEKMSADGEELFVDAYIRGLPVAVRMPVSTKATSKRNGSGSFTIHDAHMRAMSTMDASALSGPPDNQRANQRATQRAPLNAIKPFTGKRTNRESPASTLCEFHASGYCRFGDECVNSHGDDARPSPKRHQGKKKKVCYNFKRSGKCRFGENCDFSHDAQPSNQSQQTSGANTSASSPSKSSQHANNAVPPPQANKVSCTKCGNPDHAFENCPGKDKTCNRCKSTAHYARACPEQCPHCNALGGATCTILCPSRPTFRKSAPNVAPP